MKGISTQAEPKIEGTSFTSEILELILNDPIKGTSGRGGHGLCLVDTALVNKK